MMNCFPVLVSNFNLRRYTKDGTSLVGHTKSYVQVLLPGGAEQRARLMGRGLHSLTPELNLRTFGAHL
jgi:hypothetical protein